MKCKYCQGEMPDDGQFCPYCGKDNLNADQGMPLLEPDVQQEQMPAFDTAAEVEEVLEQEGEAVIYVYDDEQEAQPDSQVEEAVASPQVKKMKRFAILSGCLAVLALLGTLLYFGIRGNWDVDLDIDFKQIFGIREDSLLGNDSYSVSDKKAAKQRETVVATLGDSQLTNGQLQVYYWMEVMTFLNDYSYYLSYFGMDYTQPLDEQMSWDEESTWQQYFLSSALEIWQSNQALAMEAEANGFQMDEEYREYLDGLAASLEATAAENGFDSADAMLQEEMGPGCKIEDYISYMEIYYMGYLYFGELYDALAPTEAEVESYFTENESDFTSQGITKDSGKYYSIRNILIAVEGGTKDEEGNTTYSDDEWAACKQKAQDLLDQWNAGAATEDSFAELVADNSADENTKEYGGLYSDFLEGDMQELFGEPYEDWCVAEERQAGDCALLLTAEGYQLVYFVGSEDVWHLEAYEGLISELSVKLVEDAVANYDLDVDYKKIVLGVVELG